MDELRRDLTEGMGPIARTLTTAIFRGGRVLDPDARHATADFILRHRNPDGGFRGRTEASDLYYTAFALHVLTALEASFPEHVTADFLDRFGDGRGVDFVHLTCLVRARWVVPALRRCREATEGLLARLERFRAGDGGYSLRPDELDGSAYAAFLAVLAYETFGVPVPSGHLLIRSLGKLRAADGGFMNEPGGAVGSTPATAAACALHVAFGEPVPAGTVEWLLDRSPRGDGFRATPQTHEPDLLSTATALVALRMTRRIPSDVREPCQRWVLGLRQPEGGFRGHRDDPMADVEYTFYGLLSLGCLGEENPSRV